MKAKAQQEELEHESMRLRNEIKKHEEDIKTKKMEERDRLQNELNRIGAAPTKEQPPATTFTKYPKQ